MPPRSTSAFPCRPPRHPPDAVDQQQRVQLARLYREDGERLVGSVGSRRTAPRPGRPRLIAAALEVALLFRRALPLSVRQVTQLPVRAGEGVLDRLQAEGAHRRAGQAVPAEGAAGVRDCREGGRQTS